MAPVARLPIQAKRRIIRRMAALSNMTRLNCVLLLVENEPDGLLATDIARRLKAPKNTMSAHFNVLKAAGLVAAQREGRKVHYRAKLEPIVDMMTLLLQNCCSGQPELCKPYMQSFLQLMGSTSGK